MIAGAGQTVTLNGAAVDPDGLIVSYQLWRTVVTRSLSGPAMVAAAGAGGAGAGGAGAGGAGAGGAGAGGMMGAAGMAAAGAGGMAAPPPPPFTGDPPAMPSINVVLPVVGNYRYSLWVTDDGGFA